MTNYTNIDFLEGRNVIVLLSATIMGTFDAHSLSIYASVSTSAHSRVDSNLWEFSLIRQGHILTKVDQVR